MVLVAERSAATVRELITDPAWARQARLARRTRRAGPSQERSDPGR